MRDWNSFEKFSFSLIVSIEDVNAMESKGKPTAGALQGLKKEKAKAGASAEDRAGHLVTHYEAFDEGAHLMQYLKAPDCARYRFKVLVMGDSQYIQEAFPSKNTDPSTAQANDDVQGKGIKWKEYFWFSFLLQRNTPHHCARQSAPWYWQSLYPRQGMMRPGAGPRAIWLSLHPLRQGQRHA